MAHLLLKPTTADFLPADKKASLVYAIAQGIPLEIILKNTPWCSQPTVRKERVGGVLCQLVYRVLVYRVPTNFCYTQIYAIYEDLHTTVVATIGTNTQMSEPLFFKVLLSMIIVVERNSVEQKTNHLVAAVDHRLEDFAQEVLPFCTTYPLILCSC